MAFSAFLELVLLSVCLRNHDLVQVDLSVEEVVVVEALEGLEHLLHRFLESLDGGFVLHLLGALVQSLQFVVAPLLLLLKDRGEDRRVGVLRLEPPVLEVDYLSERVNLFTPLDHGLYDVLDGLRYHLVESGEALQVNGVLIFVSQVGDCNGWFLDWVFLSSHLDHLHHILHNHSMLL
jgi:hypothetical protein